MVTVIDTLDIVIGIQVSNRVYDCLLRLNAADSNMYWHKLYIFVINSHNAV